MARPSLYAPLSEPGFTDAVARGYRPALSAVLGALARRIDAGTSTRDLAALAGLVQTTARELAAEDDPRPASPAARLARELASETPS